MQLVGYIRVSTLSQADDGQGLNIQELAIRQWVKANGHRLVVVNRDEGVSGKIEERDGLEEALASITFNGVEGLIVASLDRLARSLTVQEAVLQTVWGAGGRVFSSETGEVLADDPDDPMRTFVRQVIGALSQLEAGMISRRLRRGREHKALNGGYAYGAPRYGRRAEGGALVTDEKEREVEVRIRQPRARGESFRRIASTLNGEGVPSKRGGLWHPQTVARVAGN